MSSASRLSWSLLSYDVPTVVDILGLPCRLRLADDTFSDSLPERLETEENGQDSVVEFTLKKETVVYSVRVRVLEFEDPDWVEGSMMGQLVPERRRHVGKEFCIPLDYSGRVRLADSTEGREYLNVKELVADFPRRVVVLQDAICASTGNKGFQVVLSGTVLELDRITKSNKISARGTRETYLICQDRYYNRELAFQNSSFIHFRKVADRTSYQLNDFIEKIPLPQTVEFVNVSPYDVVEVDDDNAKELLTILSGPVELKEVCRFNFFVGFVELSSDDKCYTVAIRKEIAPNILVNMPVSFIREYSEQESIEKPALETNVDANSDFQNDHRLFSTSLQDNETSNGQCVADLNHGTGHCRLFASSHDVIPSTTCDESFMNCRRSPEVTNNSQEASLMGAAAYYNPLYSRIDTDDYLTDRSCDIVDEKCRCYSNDGVLPDITIHCDHCKNNVRKDTKSTSCLWTNTACTEETNVRNDLNLCSINSTNDPTNCSRRKDHNVTTVPMDDSSPRAASSIYLCGSIAAIGGHSPEVHYKTSDFGINSPEVEHSSPARDRFQLSFVNNLDFFRDSQSDTESRVSHGQPVDELTGICGNVPDIGGDISNNRPSCDILNKKLYMFNDTSGKPLLLRNVVQYEDYMTEERPATPPLPPKLACHAHTLKYRLSDSMATHGDGEDVPHFKKKSSSMGDIQEPNVRNSLPRSESWRFKSYLSQFSMKLKSSASQILFGVDMHSEKRTITKRPSCRSAIRDVTDNERNSVLGSGFTSYINAHDQNRSSRSAICDANDIERVSVLGSGFTCYINAHDDTRGNVTASNRSIIDAKDRHSNHYIKDDVIYASVDWSKKGPTFHCVVCQMNYKNLTKGI